MRARRWLLVVGVLFFSGFTAGVLTGDAAPGIQGMLSALLGGLLSIPAAKIGDGLKRVGVPGERIPLMTSAGGALLGYGLGALVHKLGGPDLRDYGAQVGTQAGLMAPQAHDNQWQKPGGARKFASDVSGAMLPKKEKP